MKKLFLLSILVMLFTLSGNAQTPELKFEVAEYDFGTIHTDSMAVTATFEFINNGDAPLVINKVSASCGCTTPDWTREPVSAKGKGFVKVSYNPKNRPGAFTKTISVWSNSSDKPITLRIKGKVVR